MKIYLVALLALCGLASAAPSGGLQCRDESGKPVDWYVIYKFPWISAKNDRAVFSGYNYAYQTSDSADDGWHLSSVQITDPKRSILAQTLSPVLGDGQKNYGTVFYSDQPPTDDNPSYTYAHAKGVLASDDKQGFWLIHTVPKLAPANTTVSGLEICQCDNVDTILIFAVRLPSFWWSLWPSCDVHLSASSRTDQGGRVLPRLQSVHLQPHHQDIGGPGQVDQSTVGIEVDRRQCQLYRH